MTSPISIFSTAHEPSSIPQPAPASPPPVASDSDTSNDNNSNEQPPVNLSATYALSGSSRKRLQTPQSATPTLRPIDPTVPTSKRRRIQPTITEGLASRIRHLSDSARPPHLVVSQPSSDPPSPLFFSHSKRSARPPLPPRFSSGEAGARMLSKAGQEDETNIKTVTLARASYNDLSPSGPAFLGIASRSTSEKSSVPKLASPDVQEGIETLRILAQIGIIELLEQDTRPTFIVDLANVNATPLGSFHVVFANSSLRSHAGLLEFIQGRSPDGSLYTPESDLRLFQPWVLSTSASSDTLEGTKEQSFAGLNWQRSTLRGRLRVVSAASGTPSPSISAGTTSSHAKRVVACDHPEFPSPAIAPPAEPDDYFGSALPIPSDQFSDPLPDGEMFEYIEGLTKDLGFFDWTRLPLSDNLPPYIQFARSIDWTSTPLGPIEFWSPDLRQMCNLIMASPHPAAMYWGDDLVAIYNEAYVMLAGQKHPKLMGQSYREAWAEIWDDVKDVFRNARETGQATMKDDDRLFLKRSNYLEETFFSWSIVPLVGADGSVSGLYNPAFEKTRRKIAERRMLTLREVGERTATARDIKGFWRHAINALNTNEFDTPFALLYSVGDEIDSDTSSIHSNSLVGSKQCYLEGSLGVPEGHQCAPTSIDLKSGHEGFGPIFREVLKTDKAVVMRVTGLKLDRTEVDVDDPMDLADLATIEIPYSMLEGIKFRGFHDPCRSVVVCPIHPTTGENTLGFLILGVNPRRPYDEDYTLFIQLLSRQLATSLASVVLFEEEIKRGQRAAQLAALDRIALSQQLAERTQEARDIETRFTRMAESSPAGLFIADSTGRIIFSNDAWYEITGIPKNPPFCADNWIDYVEEKDRVYVQKLWSTIVNEMEPVTAEFRFKFQWHDASGNRSETWVLFSAHPEKTSLEEGGELKSVFGNLTNISAQKWAQGFQKRKTEEAVELKRQQENFIDITSHEMRNPLSAILQSADQITLALGELELHTDAEKDIIENSMDAAQTIVLCAQHQRRIVDDVLTLSKIDSQMLMVTPVDVQPLAIVQRALKMFEGEIQTAGIDMQLTVDRSYEELAVDWVRMDPQRVVQVLINLMTNAIKFTSNFEDGERSIAVRISASLERPSEHVDPLVQYFRSKGKYESIPKPRPDMGDGEEVFIEFSVQDTGPGLSDEEKKILFNRFTQASPRTHVQYGGSGLGLFISRELTELQGGEIGVASEAGKGSTFAFYISSRRSSRPQNPELGIPELLRSVETKTRRGERPSSGASQIKRDRSNITVLIVEDNLVNQRVLQKQLVQLGFGVYVANHGREALDRLQESTFWAQDSEGSQNPEKAFELTIVLMDQEMPVMDGMVATKRIRELESQGKLNGHVPVIGVTANARREQIEALIDAGMDDVVSKPFRIPDLVPKIEELAARYSSHK